MRIALFGGTGFIGTYIVKELIQRGHTPVLLVRPGSEAKVIHRKECIIVPGDIKDDRAVREVLDGCDAVVYTIGIIREFRRKGITFDELHYRGVKRVVDLSVEYGVERFVLMSANGVKPDGTVYQKTKFMAEQYLRNTGLRWTIFRPSVVFGDPAGKTEFCSQLRDQVINIPFPAPLFYSGIFSKNAGSFELSPVYVKDLAAAVTMSLHIDESIGKIYKLGGPDTLDWKTVIKTIGKACGKNKWTIPVPAWGIKFAAYLFDRFSIFPISRDQITMLMEGNTCDSRELIGILESKPVQFTVESLTYLKQ